jgi:kumamolisin
MSTSWVQVQSSTPRRPAGAARIDEIDPDQQLTVTVTVRGRDLDVLDATVRALDETPAGAPVPDPGGAGQRHGADPNDLERVASFYRDQGLADRRAECAPAVRCGPGQSSGDPQRLPGRLRELPPLRGHLPRPGRPLLVPTDLADLITAVLGLEDRPQADTRHVVSPRRGWGLPRSARSQYRHAYRHTWAE